MFQVVITGAQWLLLEAIGRGGVFFVFDSISDDSIPPTARAFKAHNGG